MNSVSEQEWRQQLLQQAEQMLAEGLRLGQLTLAEAEDLSSHTQLGTDHNYEYEIAPWQLRAVDASVEFSDARSDERKTAALFLDAGRRFTEVHDFKRSLICLHAAVNYARRVRGPEARDVEVRAAGAIAYAYLTLGEIASDEAKAEARVAAARYFELKGFLEAQQGDPKGAAVSYSAAGSYYRTYSHFEESARAAGKERESFQALSDTRRAGEALIKRSEMLFAASKGESDRRTEAVGALLDAGRLLAREESERARAAEALLLAGRRALEILQTSSGSYAPDFPRIVIESLGEARAIYNRMGEFEKADESHYLLSRIGRTRFPRLGRVASVNPSFLMSLLLDIVWGYGTRPRRLLPSASAVILVFSGLYFLVGNVQWANATTSGGFMTRVLAALVLSMTALLPAQLIERIAKLKMMPVIVVGRIGEVLVLLESVIGLALVAMAMFSSTRWIKRRYLPSGDN